MRETIIWITVCGGLLSVSSAVLWVAASMYGRGIVTNSFQLVLQMFGIYIGAVMMFAMFYLLVAKLDPNAFSFSDAPSFAIGRPAKFAEIPQMAISAFYFSMATMTSTGFGDIHAKSSSAQLLVAAQMFLGYFLTVVVFSALAGLAFRRAKFLEDDDEQSKLPK